MTRGQAPWVHQGQPPSPALQQVPVFPQPVAHETEMPHVMTLNHALRLHQRYSRRPHLSAPWTAEIDVRLAAKVLRPTLLLLKPLPLQTSCTSTAEVFKSVT